MSKLATDKDYETFTLWIMDYIFNNDGDYETFCELICRKLYKMGLIKPDGEYWVAKEKSCIEK